MAPKTDAGSVDVVVTYLEMRAPPTRPSPPPPMRKLALLRAEIPTVSFYRYLYNTVGEPWLWYVRRAMSDKELAEIITDEAVEIYVLYIAGVPAGFAEIDRRDPADIELAYFGLMPEFTGQGLGPFFLDEVVASAWRHEPDRIWVHTCNLDHKRALATYQRAGFVPYDQETRADDHPLLLTMLRAKEDGRLAPPD